MLPELRTLEGLEALREAGYGFSAFDLPRQFKMQAEIVASAVKVIQNLTDEPKIVYDTAYLILDSLLAAPNGLQFFSRFPKEEIAQFGYLAVASRLNHQPVPVVCPVCPDYRGHYQIGDGISRTAEAVMVKIPTIKEFFEKRGLSVFIAIQLADVEAYDQFILEASGETEAGFLGKTRTSIEKIQTRIDELGLAGIVQAESMSEALGRSGIDYFYLKEVKAEQISKSENRKVRRAIEALVTERQKLGDFETISKPDRRSMVVRELADYSVYGDYVGGRAVILSADALSAVPAYNFLRGKEKAISPTVYLKDVKIAYDR
ncbi:MAG: hypothetical protein V1810_03950 [Candidatus Beckwithbacteria bacterium]